MANPVDQPNRKRSLQMSRKTQCVFIIILCFLATFTAAAQNSSADEYEIRGAMLFNLTRFIEWPAWKLDPGHTSFVVCVVGSDPIGASLDRSLRNKSVGTKPVLLRHLSSADSANDCHILYISAGERNYLARTSAELARNGVLTISELSDAARPEQVIGLPTIEEHVRIDVNLGTAQHAGLTISSKLLHIATVSH